LFLFVRIGSSKWLTIDLLTELVAGASDDNQSALQKHVVFFDRNKDGVIYPWETFQGSLSLSLSLSLWSFDLLR